MSTVITIALLGTDAIIFFFVFPHIAIDSIFYNPTRILLGALLLGSPAYWWEDQEIKRDPDFQWGHLSGREEKVSMHMLFTLVFAILGGILGYYFIEP